MQFLQNLIFLGAAAQLFGIILYIRDIIKGTTKPNLVTWSLWFIAPMIAVSAAMSEGVGWSVLPMFMAGLCPFLVLIFSLISRRSYWGLTKFDFVCGLLSVLALILWWLTKNPTVAIIFAIASDGLAGLPTIIKSWKYPETETPVTYLFGVFSAAVSFFAIKKWIFASYSLPIYLILINLFIFLAGYHKKWFVKKN